MGESGGPTDGLGLRSCGFERSEGEQHSGRTSLPELMVPLGDSRWLIE
jgi:hypothetical protein